MHLRYDKCLCFPSIKCTICFNICMLLVCQRIYLDDSNNINLRLHTAERVGWTLTTQFWAIYYFNCRGIEQASNGLAQEYTSCGIHFSFHCLMQKQQLECWSWHCVHQGLQVNCYPQIAVITSNMYTNTLCFNSVK